MVVEAASSAPAEPGDYSLPLGASYVLAPLLALAVGGALSEVSRDDTAAVVGGCLLFLVPPAVHASYGESGRGFSALGSMLGVTAIGVGVGGGLGYAIGSASCDPDTNSECDLAYLVPMFVGALVGGVVGYGVNAVQDTSNNSSLPSSSAGEGPLAIQPWLSPVVSARGQGEGTLGAFSGVSLGATGAW